MILLQALQSTDVLVLCACAGLIWSFKKKIACGVAEASN